MGARARVGVWVRARRRWKARPVGKMLGADISFLPELESRGVKFSDDKGQRDAIQILKDHGFNYIRLRIFNNPAKDGGYSPGKGVLRSDAHDADGQAGEGVGVAPAPGFSLQ